MPPRTRSTIGLVDALEVSGALGRRMNECCGGKRANPKDE
jgi:hypothetical protein